MAYFSNGSEGIAYEERWCYRCRFDQQCPTDDACPVLCLHLVHNYDQCAKTPAGELWKEVLGELIPRTKDGLGNERCRMFVPTGDAPGQLQLVDRGPRTRAALAALTLDRVRARVLDAATKVLTGDELAAGQWNGGCDYVWDQTLEWIVQAVLGLLGLPKAEHLGDSTDVDVVKHCITEPVQAAFETMVQLRIDPQQHLPLGPGEPEQTKRGKAKLSL